MAVYSCSSSARCCSKTSILLRHGFWHRLLIFAVVWGTARTTRRLNTMYIMWYNRDQPDTLNTARRQAAQYKYNAHHDVISSQGCFPAFYHSFLNYNIMIWKKMIQADTLQQNSKTIKNVNARKQPDPDWRSTNNKAWCAHSQHGVSTTGTVRRNRTTGFTAASLVYK